MKATPEMIEAGAKAIFEHWQFYGHDPEKPKWVEGGNSTRQQKARDFARAALSASPPAQDDVTKVVEACAQIADHWKEHNKERMVEGTATYQVFAQGRATADLIGQQIRAFAIESGAYLNGESDAT